MMLPRKLSEVKIGLSAIIVKLFWKTLHTSCLYAYSFAPQELPMPRVPMPYRGAHFLFDDLERFLHITSMTFHMDAVRRLCAQPRHLGFSTQQPAGPMGGGDQEVTGLQRWSTHQLFQVVRNKDMEHFLL